MKILFLDAVQDFGGSQKSTINLIKNIEIGNECMYVDFWGTSTELFNVLSNQNIYFKVLNKRDSPIIINEGKGKISTIKNTITYFFNYLFLKKEIKKIIAEFKPDYVIVNNYKSLSILEDSSYKIIYFERTWFANTKINFFKKKLFKKVNYYFAVSEATRKALYIKGMSKLDKIFVLPNSIKIKKVYETKDNFLPKIQLLNIGGYLPSKGLHHSIEIAKLLKAKKINFHLDIVGVLYKGKNSQKFYENLVRDINDNDLSKYITLHKNITDMSIFYNNADILIHPTYTEGLPRVVMEAMANNILVIANSVGGVNDYILDGYTGFLTDLNNLDKYVEYITKVYNNINLYNAITKNAYELICNCYNDEVQKDNINKIFNKLNGNNSNTVL